MSKSGGRRVPACAARSPRSTGDACQHPGAAKPSRLPPPSLGFYGLLDVGEALVEPAAGPAFEDLGDERWLGDHPLADDLVFRSEDGAPVTPALFSQWFETQTKAAGLPRIRLHDLRHGHAIQLRDAGVPAEVISKRLGHASIAFTIDTYMSASPPSAGRGGQARRGPRGGPFLTLP
jgi:hypothetical protein